MFKYVKETISKAAKSRMLVLGAVFLVLTGVLVYRLFELQILKGESYLNDFTKQIIKKKTIPGTRGNFYDRNGKLIAYNKLAYAVTFEDSVSYETMHEKNLALNGSMYGILKILEKNGDQIVNDFGIALNSAGEYEFTYTNKTSLMRFKADIYGQSYVEDLKDFQKNATAGQMIEDMSSTEMFGITDEKNTKEDLDRFGLPQKLSSQEILQLCIMRSKVAANSYQKYLSATLATNISDRAMADLMENKDNYRGLDVTETTMRVYEDSLYYAPILGYTGNISAEELADYNKDAEVYTGNDIVGKGGLEQYFESELKGASGSEQIYVDNLGKVLKKDNRVEPQAGNNVQLTLDTDYQIAGYKILEQYIAGVVYTHIRDVKAIDKESFESSDDLVIPVYDIYYALFENNVLDVKHIASEQATENEKQVYQLFLSKQDTVFAQIKEQLTTQKPTPQKDLSEEMQAYTTYIVENMLKTKGILKEDAIDTSDKTYLAWSKDGSISLQEFLTYAISKNWMDLSSVNTNDKYMNSAEVYSTLADYLAQILAKDIHFSKKVYKYMIQDETLSGTQVCLLLFDQEIIKMNTADYDSLSSGTLSSYDFISQKIYNLEITPAQLALDPCTGSMVINDPNTGETIACVTYPSYDNNRLANEMDAEYFSKLSTDLSSPFYNKATQEITAPGSTYKMVAATAGVMEGVVGIYDPIVCTGKFDLVDPPIRCWISPSSHQAETLVGAIRDSCNFYFNTLGYRLGELNAGQTQDLSAQNQEGGTQTEDMTEEDEKAIDEVGIETLAKYAAMYGLDSETGLEIGETPPHISDNAMAPSAMGQGTNAFSTSQLSRYVATVANGGTCYDLTMVDKITDSEGRMQEEKKPKVYNTVELPQELWDAIHTGMNEMVKNNANLKDIGIDMAGKTGTAEETGVPSHGLFVGYAPYIQPEYAIAVRITNGYTSANAALAAGDMIKYIFGLEDKEKLIPGHAIQVDASIARTD